MTLPGPSEAEIEEIVRIAARTPDHGKLNPWRFVHVPQSARPALVDLLHRALRAEDKQPSQAELDLAERFAKQAPELIVALSSPVVPHKISLWEQQLSCGAACMNLLMAAHAMGYSAGWITGWPAYSDMVRNAFGGPDDRIAGFIFIGTPSLPLEERPRPALENVFSRWGEDQS